MFGKVKKWLGIEGLKLELILPEEVEAKDGFISGKIKFYSTQPHTTRRINIALLERYTKGRKGEQTTEEFKIGSRTVTKPIQVPANRPVIVSFKLPFELVKSEMDTLQEKNILLGQLVKTAKWFSGVNSEYRVEVEVEVVDSPINAFERQSLKLL